MFAIAISTRSGVIGKSRKRIPVANAPSMRATRTAPVRECTRTSANCAPNEWPENFILSFAGSSAFASPLMTSRECRRKIAATVSDASVLLVKLPRSGPVNSDELLMADSKTMDDCASALPGGQSNRIAKSESAWHPGSV